MAEDEDRSRGVKAVMWMLEHGQDYVSAMVGIVLLVMAAVVLVAALVGFFADIPRGSVDAAANTLLDRILLTLILVEIVHTVVLSLRAHHLVAQPLIVVGLVATIRKVLFVLSTPGAIGTAELALLLAMVVVFAAAFILLGRLDRADT